MASTCLKSLKLYGESQILLWNPGKGEKGQQILELWDAVVCGKQRTYGGSKEKDSEFRMVVYLKGV